MEDTICALTPDELERLYPEPTFRYVMSIPQDVQDQHFDNPTVRSVKFDISRYGDVIKILEFDHPVTPREAIKAAERYLSLKVSKAYFRRITASDQLFTRPWSVEKFEIQNRGNMLSDATFLEGLDDISVDGDMSEIALQCGS